MMKKLGQLYRVPLDEMGRARAMAGQMVLDDVSYDDYILGFINAVDLEKDEMEICLFQPGVLPDNVTTLVAEELSPEEVSSLLRVHCESDVMIAHAWQEALEGPSYEETMH